IVSDDYAGDTSTTGQISSDGVGVTGNIETIGDHDWFRTTLTAGVQYRFDEHGSPSGQGTLTDPLLRLWNSTGTTQLATNDDSNGTFESEFFYTPATTGTYYLDAAAYAASELRGTYTVHEAPDDYAAGTSTTGVVATNGAGTIGSVEVSGDQDWF